MATKFGVLWTTPVLKSASFILKTCIGG